MQFKKNNIYYMLVWEGNHEMPVRISKIKMLNNYNDNEFGFAFFIKDYKENNDNYDINREPCMPKVFDSIEEVFEELDFLIKAELDNLAKKFSILNNCLEKNKEFVISEKSI
jgi:hypothetical protein